MSFFQKISNWFKNAFNRKKKQDEWANRFDLPPAQPKNPLPLDPGRDPWIT